jgi:hypothetical protein
MLQQLPLDAGEYLFFNFITLKLIEYLLPPLLYLPSLPDATLPLTVLLVCFTSAPHPLN